MNNIIALIPARSGSKRIPNKNIKILGGHPLIAYAIQSALDSEVFTNIMVSSDSAKILDIADYYGANLILRPPELAKDDSPDHEWINHALQRIESCNYYAILRPTNPFRTKHMIRNAIKKWDKITALKAVERVKQHPGKMWRLISSLSSNEFYMMGYYAGVQHLQPTQNLEELYVQNGSIELRLVHEKASVFYQPYFTQDNLGFDINDLNDWILAEALIEKGYAKLPEIKKEPYDFTTV